MPHQRSEVGARQGLIRNDGGKPTRGMKEEEARRPLRRSKRLQEICEKELVLQGQRKEREHKHHPACCNVDAKERVHNLPKTLLRKREIGEDIERPSKSNLGNCRKRARISAVAVSQEDSNASINNTNEEDGDPIMYWCRHGRWPKEYFELDNDMSRLLTRTKSTTSLARKKSDSASNPSNSNNPSEEKQRDAKSVDYKEIWYPTLLATKCSFMRPSPGGITSSSKTRIKALLENEQAPPQDTLFRDDLFESTCEAIRNRNETRVIRDIALLIVPSAEALTAYGATDLKCLIESVNEGWNNSIPVTKTRPQPDYAVGFRREAFTAEQLKKLEPFIGGLFETSYFGATYYMYFPFLTCEVKWLDLADRQNAHSMTIAVRAIVELFRLANREKEVDREVLAFSVSHDDQMVSIYGHYAVIEGKYQKYYRYPIRSFSLTARDGEEKWTAYQFTKNIYDTWMPEHLKRICLVIDQLPNVNFDISQSELQFSEVSGLSQDLGAYGIAQSSEGSESAQAEPDPSVVGTLKDTPNTSVTGGAFKRPRRECAAGERK